jgi:hypothetical protein
MLAVRARMWSLSRDLQRSELQRPFEAWGPDVLADITSNKLAPLASLNGAPFNKLR